MLSGGVFQNRRLLEATASGLHAAGLRVLVPELLPPGDGGISYGQAAVAARQAGDGDRSSVRTRSAFSPTTVYVDGENRPFGALSGEQIRARADELRSAIGWGPTARIAPVAQAWRELSMAIERAGVGTVGELDPGVVAEMAPRLWIVPPAGGLLS